MKSPNKEREAAEEEKDDQPKDDEKDNYVLMYYKNHQSWGIRRRGGKQVVSIAKKTDDQSDLEVLAKKALNSLNQGDEEEVVKLLVKYKVERL